jgi:hypothetical protein
MMAWTRPARALFAGMRLLVRMILIGPFVAASRSVEAWQYKFEKYIERSLPRVGGL